MLTKTEMARTSQTRNKRQGQYPKAVAVAMMVIIAAAMLVMGSCSRKPVMAHSRFVHLPADGWQRTMPLSFVPEYDDSAAHYDIILAIRHDNSYRYSNLSLVVDVIAADSTVNRKAVDIAVADDYGNWSGGGFGSLYQCTRPVIGGVTPDKAHSVVIWQAMNGCDTLCGLVDVGIIASPVSGY